MSLSRQEKSRIFQEKFRGRSDVYGVKWHKTLDDGTVASGYAPVCINLWKPNCHLKLKDGIRCDSCLIKEYAPVTDASVLKHIDGDERQNQFVLLPDGTVNFFAIDFDCKPGKEDKGYTFTDVSRASSVLKEWKIPHAIARSTTDGFHVYVFNQSPYPANKARAIVFHLFEEAGFMDYVRQGVKPLPEIFPKQAYASPDGIGNGITPPMVESRFLVGRNCLVDERNIPFGEDLPHADMVTAQWEHLRGIESVSGEHLDALIVSADIPVYEENYHPSSGGRTISGSNKARQNGKWVPPQKGSIEKVLEGCAAVGRIRDKCARGEVIGHDEGMGLYHLAMNTPDGVEWFNNNVPGWGQTDKDRKQLEHSLNKGYTPWTCKKFQEKSICTPGTQCFKRKPPVEIVEGQYVERTDLPEDRWPEPSPIRYSFGPGDDFLNKLIREVDDLKSEADQNVRMQKLKAIADRAQVFDEKQQKLLKEHIRKEKVAKAGDVSKTFKQAAEEIVKERSEATKAANAAAHDILVVQGNTYRKLLGHGYSRVVEVKGENKDILITDTCTIHITEERNYRSDDAKVEKAVYVGKAVTVDLELPFEIDVSTWNDNGKFNDVFVGLLGSRFNVIKKDIDYLRQAVVGFSAKAGIARTSFICMQGWKNGYYLMPSVVVGSDGVRPNTEHHVSLDHKEMARHLDFQILNHDEVRDVLFHIKTDFLDTWPRLWTTVGLSHALLPAIAKPLEIQKKPTLFFEGLSGIGKTEFTHTLQYFWGRFRTLTSIFNSTSKGALSQGFEFKDTLLVFDDFKGITKEQDRLVRDMIQASYDGYSGVKLRRDSSQQTSKPPEAVLLMTGEHFVSNEASVVARTILIEEGGKLDTLKTQDKFRKCAEHRPLYSGITPHFIHFFLQEDRRTLIDHLDATEKHLLLMSDNRQNAKRVCSNLALNHLVWTLLVGFMEHMGVVSNVESKLLVDEHTGYCEKLLSDILSRCEAEQNSLSFVDKLKDLIYGGEVSLEGSKYCRDYKVSIGMVPEGQPYPGRNVAYLYSQLAWREVSRFANMSQAHLPGNTISVGRQLLADGIIIDSSEGRATKQVRLPDGSRRNVWVVDMDRLGLCAPKLYAVKNTPEKIVPKITLDANGLI